MTTEVKQTTRDRVLQAVARGYDLRDELIAAQAAVKEAKLNQDTVHLDPTREEAVAESQGILTEVSQTIAGAFKAAQEKAAVPLNRAQTIYNKAMAEATGVRDKAITGVQAEHDDAVSEAEKADGVRNATAQAGLHRSTQEVAAIEQTTGQNRAEVLRTLGIDLNVLVV